MLGAKKDEDCELTWESDVQAGRMRGTLSCVKYLVQEG